MDARGLLEFTRMTGAVVERIRRLPIPVIAAVNGVAAGAGAVIALAADLRILAETASFSFLFARGGSAPERTWALRTCCPASSGTGHATELLLLGESIEAERAVAIGLATKVVADAALSGSAG